jgi:hypothetical protein
LDAALMLYFGHRLNGKMFYQEISFSCYIVKAHPRSTFSFGLDFQLLLDWLGGANVAPPIPLSTNGLKAESLI